MLNHLHRNKLKKYISLLLIGLIMQCMLINYGAEASETSKVEELHNEKIARGITYQENRYSDYKGIASRNEKEFIITADLNDPTVRIISGKARDKVLKLETVSEQIAREQSKGQNVVAGINGDMYYISTGTPDYGSPQGLQVKDGRILVGFDTLWSEQRFPVFAINRNGQPMAGYVSLDARLSVVDANPDSNSTMAIDTINRNNTAIMSNRMILETPQLADASAVGFTDEQALNGTLTVLKNITGSQNGSVQLGREYTADVVSIGDTVTGPKSTAIPVDGMVLASQGTKATWVKNHIKKGDKVRFIFNLKDQTGKILNLDQAVTAWLPLVEKGHALTEEDMLDKCKNDWISGAGTIKAANKGRTAIGYTADNKVIALIFDGGGAVQESYGMDLPGMAARMKELGAVAAVSLDGGGSTQINSRLFGETKIQLMNHPSDNRERPVSNTILFASNAPKTSDIKELKVSKDITIYKNGTYALQVRGADSNGNPADLSKADIQWTIKQITSAVPVDSTIDKNGLFTAGKRSSVQKVSASTGSLQSSAFVTVVDSVDFLGLTDSSTLALEPNAQKQFNIVARTQDGKPVIISNQAAQWSVTPSTIGSIDRSGLLTVRGKGNGTVTAKVGDKKTSVNFVIGLTDQLIDSYETNDPASYSVTGYVGGTCQISSEQARSGNNSLRVDYDYAAWDKVYNGTINVIMNADKKGAGYTSTIRPKKLGMWVYGDGQSPWLRANLIDANGNTKTLNLASNINWVGWKYVETVIPADMPAPICLDHFYMVEINKSKNLKGTVYFDDIRFIY